MSEKAFAKIVADSKYRDTRLITLEIDLWRAILPEFNTHRMISRNFQSTRAVPTIKLINQVKENPYIPVKFARNQQGMVAGESFTGSEYDKALSEWVNAAKAAANYAEFLSEMGVHKEVAGRLLEPFMWTKGVVTATEKVWNEFFKLRLHPDAQPEIYALAEKIKEALDNSKPVELKQGWWHTPYYDRGFWTPFHLDEDCTDNPAELGEAIQISASCNAQVSYRRLDDSLEKATKVYDMLNLPVEGVYPYDPPHFSPTEHIAKAGDCEIEMSGNFHTDDFIQYRKVLEKGLEKKYIGGD